MLTRSCATAGPRNSATLGPLEGTTVLPPQAPSSAPSSGAKSTVAPSSEVDTSGCDSVVSMEDVDVIFSGLDSILVGAVLQGCCCCVEDDTEAGAEVGRSDTEIKPKEYKFKWFSKSFASLCVG